MKTRKELSQKYFDQAAALEAQWLERVKANSVKERGGALYKAAWKKFNSEAELDLDK